MIPSYGEMVSSCIKMIPPYGGMVSSCIEMVPPYGEMASSYIEMIPSYEEMVSLYIKMAPIYGETPGICSEMTALYSETTRPHRCRSAAGGFLGAGKDGALRRPRPRAERQAMPTDIGEANMVIDEANRELRNTNWEIGRFARL